MPQMTILKVITNSGKSNNKVLLLTRQQHLIALQFGSQISPTRMRPVAEPFTTDFLSHVLHALGGTLKEVVVDLSSDERLYTQLQVRDQSGLHTIEAGLNDGLGLALREQSHIAVSEKVFTRCAVKLTDYGTTEAEQMADIYRRAERDPDSLRRRIVQEQLNLDFSLGLRGWRFIGDATYGSYMLDPHTSMTGRNSLAITLYKPFVHRNSAILYYKDRLAERYRGQRIRLSAYVKVEQMPQPTLQLQLSWSTDKISSVTGATARASRLTRSRIVSQTSDEESAWFRHEMVIDVPRQAQELTIELQTREQGKIWLDNVELTIVDQSIPLTGTILRPPAEQPLNLDFSEGLEYWMRDEGYRGHYAVEIDMHTSPCALLKSMVANPAGACTLQQMVVMERYQGKAVRLTADIKTMDVLSHASLFIGMFLINEETRAQSIITGTNAWSTIALDWRVPHMDRGIMVLGMALQGAGQVWLRDVHLDIIEGNEWSPNLYP